MVNFLQEGHRMQKPEHVDNKLLVEKHSVYFHENVSRVIISALFIPLSKFFGNLVPLMRFSDVLCSWPSEIWLSGSKTMLSMLSTCENLFEFIFSSSCATDMTFQTEVLTTLQTYSQCNVLITSLFLYFNCQYKS